MCRTLLVSLTAAVVVAASAPSSHAGLIVWQRGTEIHAMRDDGTGRVRLLSASSVAGALSIARPHVASDGTTVVFQSRSPASSGASLTGIYKLEAGRRVSRLSPPAGGACAPACPSHDVEPEVAGASGRVVFAHRAGKGAALDGDLRSLSLVGGDRQLFMPGCHGPGDLAADPSANPAAPAEVVYGGCQDSARQHRLMVSQAARVGERVIRIDDRQIVDPSFAPDGSKIVAVEGGDLPGIWTYPTTAGDPQRLVATAPGQLASSPRLIEAGTTTKTERLLFSMLGDVWTVPTGSCPCGFPAGATRLTTDGPTIVDSSPSWTSRTRITPLLFDASGDFTGGDLADFPEIDEETHPDENIFGRGGREPRGRRDRRPPRLQQLELSPRSFKPYPARGRSQGRGTVVSFRLNEPATVAFRIERTITRRRRAATHHALRGTFWFAAHKPRTRLRITGWLNGAPLKPGSYRLRAVATDRHNRTSKPQYARFSVPSNLW